MFYVANVVNVGVTFGTFGWRHWHCHKAIFLPQLLLLLRKIVFCHIYNISAAVAVRKNGGGDGGGKPFGSRLKTNAVNRRDAKIKAECCLIRTISCKCGESCTGEGLVLCRICHKCCRIWQSGDVKVRGVVGGGLSAQHDLIRERQV